MKLNMITPAIANFDELMDTYIKDYTEFNEDEKAIVYLAKNTRNSLDFNKLTLTNTLFAILEKTKYDLSEEISKSKDALDKIYDNLNASLDIILKHEDEEHEHGHDHDHDHSHDHFHHLELDEIQDDIKNIIDNLTDLKTLVSNISAMVVSVINYQEKEIDEETFKADYEKFKESLN